MTEAEWLAATEPSGLTRFLCDVQGLNRKPNGRRKLRLFACACGRRAWHLLDDNRSREAVEIAERYADGVVSKAALERIWNRKQPRFLYWALCDQIGPAVLQTPHEASFLLALAADHKMEEGYREAESAEQSMQVTLLRDIFGNPFRPPVFSPAWRTDTAVTLARQMYESRDFSAMPILADALQDAGCDNTDILDHCRDASLTHVRGCWVVDLVLGKE